MVLSQTIREQQDVRQPSMIWRLAAVWMLQAFALFAGTQMAVQYLSVHYALSAHAVDILYNTIYALIGVGQLIIAVLADRYLGWLRAARLAAGMGILALAGFAFVMSSDAPQLSYQGKNYEVRMIDNNASVVQYVVVDKAALAMKVMDNGDLHLLGDSDGSFPKYIPAAQWQLVHAQDGSDHYLILLTLTLLIAARCFGAPIIYAVVGACYPNKDNARLVGYCIIYVFMNLGVFLAQNSQIWMISAIGLRAVMLICALAILGAYMLLRFDGKKLSSLPGMVSPVDRAVLPHIYKILAALFLVLFFLIFNLALASPMVQQHIHIPSLFASLSLNHMGVLLLLLYGAVWGGFLFYSYKLEGRAPFYALLCVMFFSLLRLVYDCMFDLGIDNVTSYSENYIDLQLWRSLGLEAVHLQLINTSVIVVLAGLGLGLWILLRHNFAPMNDLIKSFIAFGMVGAAYMILSIGTHDLLENGLAPFGYYMMAATLVPLAEFIITPTLIAAVYRLRQHHLPAASLTIFNTALSFSNLISHYFSETIGLREVTPGGADIAAKQLEYGNAFLSTGTMGLVGAMFILFALLPIITRWLAIATAPAQPAQRPDIQMTGFDRY